MLAQVDRVHRRETREFQRVVEQRNALLRIARDEMTLPDAEIAFWDHELVRLAASISLRRATLVSDLVPAFREATARFAGGASLDITYGGQVEGETVADRVAGYERLLREKRDRERWQGATLVGPHRDDLVVTSAGRDLPSFASRGEHRSAVLALKLAEATWLGGRIGETPVFLLDDVLSELDPGRREALASAIPEDAQAFLTTASPTSLPEALRDRAAVVPVRRGEIGT